MQRYLEGSRFSGQVDYAPWIAGRVAGELAFVLSRADVLRAGMPAAKMSRPSVTIVQLLARRG